MGNIPEFVGFPKIARLFRDIYVTEKIDGTSAQIFIDELGNVQAGSRNRWITVHDDNHGFAAWVLANKEELMKLGPGRHYGEWWGQGINRGYGLKEKRFSLFNVTKWTWDRKPACCGVVPILYQGPWIDINQAVKMLKFSGSQAAPGYMNPEGIVIFHTAGNVLFKVTCEHDEKPKGLVQAC